MGYLLKVGNGIFIDNKCSGIKNVSFGYFIPEYPCGVTFEPGKPGYHDDLKAFLDKWFPDSDRWTATKADATIESLAKEDACQNKEQTK